MTTQRVPSRGTPEWEAWVRAIVIEMLEERLSGDEPAVVYDEPVKVTDVVVLSHTRKHRVTMERFD